MKNIIKIALFSIVCLSNSFASNSLNKSILNKKNDFHDLLVIDTVKVTTTDPKKNRSQKENNP